jgi:hypothetical protein
MLGDAVSATVGVAAGATVCACAMLTKKMNAVAKSGLMFFI